MGGGGRSGVEWVNRREGGCVVESGWVLGRGGLVEGVGGEGWVGGLVERVGEWVGWG